MRHIVGIALAIVAALVLFFAGGWGYLRLLRAPAAGLPAGGGSLLHNQNVLAAFAALLAVGLVIGLLAAVPWFSPLATGLPGLALLALTGLYLASVRHAVRLIPLRGHAFGAGFEAMLIDGVLALAGLAMIMPLFVPSRWRRLGYEEDEEFAEDESAAVATGLLAPEPTTVTPVPPGARASSYFGGRGQQPGQGETRQDPFPPQ